jgi:hypothetical protein
MTFIFALFLSWITSIHASDSSEPHDSTSERQLVLYKVPAG